MFKAMLLVILIAGVGGMCYWYGYRNGKADGDSHTTARSLENSAGKFLDKMRNVDLKYRDKDGNVVIPKLEWEDMKNGKDEK
jgi:hypothetical protein